GRPRDEDEVALTALRPREPVRQLRQCGLTTDYGGCAVRWLLVARRRTCGPGGRRGVHRRHRRQEAIALAIDGLDEPLAATAIPNRLAHGFDRTLECGLADELLWPDLLTQLLLGDDPVRMRQQVSQDLEGFAPQPP